MIVMTGSTLATRFPEAGEEYRYEVEGLGSVSATLA
jgi:2-keto-4-pentenoate hydratase